MAPARVQASVAATSADRNGDLPATFGGYSLFVSTVRLRSVVTLAAAVVLGAIVLGAQASVGAAHARPASSGVAARPALVPRGDILAADMGLHLIVLDQSGSVLRRLPWWHAPSGVGLLGLELAPDRQHAFVSVERGDLPAHLYEVDLATGGKRLLADAASPALSPDGSRLLYLANRRPKKLTFPLLTALVVRNLSSGRQRVIPFHSRLTIGTPPDMVTNWSLDGRRAVLSDGRHLRLIDTATARFVESQPSVGPNHSLAPVFLEAHRLVVLADCCVGHQHLVTVDLRSGRQAPFAEISAPVVSIRRLGPSRLLVANQLGQLLLVSRGHSKTIATGVSAATA